MQNITNLVSWLNVPLISTLIPRKDTDNLFVKVHCKTMEISRPNKYGYHV